MGRTNLIKNGKVWDGSHFFYADVLTNDGIVSQIAENIDLPADFIYDAAGMIVSAGFVDAHTHLKGISADIYGTPADSSCFPFGVTAAVDASAVKKNRNAADACTVNAAVLSFVDFQNDQADFSKAERAFSVYEEKVIGIKCCFSAPETNTLAPLKDACAFARDKRLPLMVHCTDSPVPMKQIVECLAPGDILTHPYHGGANTAADEDFAALRLAKEKGVWLDAGFAGHVHTNFAVLNNAASLGLFPDTISTDITKKSAYQRGGRYGMTTAMSIARHVGMKEEDIFRAVTSAPARMFGKDKLWGSLQVGGCADIAVVQECEEGFSFQTKSGNNLISKTGYRCMLTIANGDIVYRN